MKQVLLHIGTGKTGTTSIQHTLDRAARKGKLGGVTYPDLMGRDHNFLAALYMAPARLPRLYTSTYGSPPAHPFDDDVATFREGLWDVLARRDKVLLSGEYLAQFVPAEATRLRDDLGRHGVTDVRVLVYVRDPASRFLSSLQQRVKGASVFSPPARWRDATFETLRVWRDVFPQLTVRPFDRSVLEGGDVVVDLLAFASGFFGEDLGDARSEIVTRNESLSAEAIILMQRYRSRFYPDEQNVLKPDSTSLHEMLQRSRADVPQTTARLRSDVAQVVLRNHAGDLEALWEDYGIDFRPDPAGGDGATTPARAGSSDITDILESHDEEVLEGLVLHALRHGFSSQPGPIRQAAAGATTGRRRHPPG